MPTAKPAESPHFGQFLRQLREDRGVTRPQLATASGLSVPTIQRAEASPICVFTRSNARRVFEAFEQSLPGLSQAEREIFLEGSGLKAILESAKLLRPTHADQAFRLFLDSLADANERHAYELLDQLITDTNPMTAVGVVSGAIAGLSARMQASAKPPLVLHEQPTVEDNWEVRRMGPVKPPPPPASQPKRRPAHGA